MRQNRRTRSTVIDAGRSLLVAAALSTTALTAVAPVEVAAQVTTSSVRGTVSDASGNPVANARISIVHVPSGASRSVATNSAGAFSAPGLRVGGPYTITLEGGDQYTGTQVTDVYLTLSRPYSLNLLARQTDGEIFQEEIVVSAKALGTNLKLGASSTFGKDNIDAQANVNRDFKNVIRQDPRVTIDSTNRNAISFTGINTRFNTLTVDGVRQNDDFGLNFSGFPTLRSPVSIDALEQVSVQIAPFDVSYGSFTGGNINVVTKSGTNDFDGSIYYFYSDDGLTGNKTGDLEVDLGNFSQKTWGGTLSGPIVKDKLWFFVNYEKYTETDTEGLDYGPAGSNRANVISGVTQSEIDQVLDISNSVYGFDPLSLPTEGASVKDEKFLAKIDWAINEDHYLTATYQHVQGTDLVPQGSLTFLNRLALPSNWYERSEPLDSLSAQLFSSWSDSFSTEAKVVWVDRKTEQSPLSDPDFAQFDIRTPSGGTIRIGPSIFQQANALTNEQLQVKLKADYLWRNHQFTVGYEWDRLDVFNLFIPRSNGEYVFNSISDFQNRTASSLNYVNSVTNNAEDAAAEFQFVVNSAYAQDTWDIRDDLTLVMGLRYDWYTSNDRPPLNENFVDRNGFDNQETLDGRGILMPRAGFNYLMDEKTIVRGGGGLFSGGSPNVWVANSFSNDGVTIVSPDNGGFVDPACAGITSSPAALTNVDGFDISDAVKACMFAGNGNVNAVDPDFDIPSLWKFNLAIDREFDLGPLGDNWLFTVEAIWSRVKDAVTWVELQREQIGTAPDGRPLYDRPFTYDLLLTNTGQGKSDSYSLSVHKGWENVKFGDVSLSASYTYSNVEDVNPAQGSPASSNYGTPATFDRNNPPLGRSNFEIKHRFNGSLTYQKAFFGDNKTTISFFFESRSGKPYSYTMIENPFPSAVFGGHGAFAFRNSQLLYVPATNDPNVVYDSPGTQAAFDDFIAQTGLAEYRGQIIPKNSQTSDWQTRIDMRIAQEVRIGSLPVVGDSGFELFFDIENLTNLIDNDWGRIQQTPFPFQAPIVNVALNGQGQYVFSNFNSDLALDPQSTFTRPSLWKLQLGVKFKF